MTPDAVPQTITSPTSGSGSRTVRTLRATTSTWGLLAALAILVAYGNLLYRSAIDASLYLRGTFFALLALAGVVLYVRRMARAEPSFDLGSIALIGFAGRVFGSTMRFQEPVDATLYHQVGIELAPNFRRLQFTMDTGREIPGTGFLRYLSGLFHVFTFDDFYSMFIVWTMFSFIGCLLVYKAFEIGVVGGDRKRFAIVLFCWPSLCYWPNSLGKEGWMVLCIGVATYGTAVFFNGRTAKGLLLLFLGILGSTMTRPHMGLMLAVGFAAAILAGSQAGATDRRLESHRRESRGKRVVGQARVGARVIAVVVLLVGGAVLVQRAAEFFKVDALGTESVSNTLDSTTVTTNQGGSAYSPVTVRNPADYPRAFFTVMFRPMIIEAKGFNDTLAALEGMTLVGLLLISFPRLKILPTRIGRQPLVVFAATYVIVFAYAFSSIGNFGILARQRSQVLPLLMVLTSLPLIKPPSAVRSSEPLSRAGLRR